MYSETYLFKPSIHIIEPQNYSNLKPKEILYSILILQSCSALKKRSPAKSIAGLLFALGLKPFALGS
jgi:hypothetical protein